MKNKIYKLITFFLISLLFIINIQAETTTKSPEELAKGSRFTIEIKTDAYTGKDTWIVKETTDGSKFCNIDSPSAPPAISVSGRYSNTYGHAYQNACTDYKWETQTQYSEPHDYDEMKELIKQAELAKKTQDTLKDNINKWITNQSAGAKFQKFPTGLISYAGDYRKINPLINIVRLDSSTAPSEGNKSGAPLFTADSVDTIGWFRDYYENCKVANEAGNVPTRYCYEPNYVKQKDGSKKIKGYKYTNPLVMKPTVTDEEKYKDDKKPTSAGEWGVYVVSSIPPCPADYLVEEYNFDAPKCENENNDETGKFRLGYEVTKEYCAKVEPVVADAYTVRLSVNSKDAFCVTPSAGFNKSYTWDTRFDASRCKNSLEVYNKNGTTSYSLDCGYAFIMAEAKRLNLEKGIEVFSYESIETAMRLFGTGITGNGSNLGEYSDEEKLKKEDYLQAGGYYSEYYTWGGPFEYVGIPWLKDKYTYRRNAEGWPAVYTYFMPDFYSIYIRTAKASHIYLKDGIRFADVGNLKDKDEKYITDPSYYLNEKSCTSFSPSCSTTSAEMESNDEFSKKRKENKLIDNDYETYLESKGIRSKCGDGSGMGVLCGKSDTEYNHTDYINAIYLYIRAYQGNPLRLDEITTLIANESDESKKNTILESQYKPIEGSTKILTELDEAGNEVSIARYAINTKVLSEYTEKTVKVDCEVGNPSCKAEIFIYDQNKKLVHYAGSYDYCKKNYCYVKFKRPECEEGQENQTLTSLVITEPPLKSTLIKKIEQGSKNEQTIFVYDDSTAQIGGYCQNIAAVKENVKAKCPCNPEEKANIVKQTGNINVDGNKNVCSKSYEPYDELFYGDPSMSTIINACYEEDQLKYDFSKDYNVNGNNIVYDAELASRYSFQAKSDDFNFCKLYCRNETRIYVGNKLTVRAGQNLKYDIGQMLIDRKIVTELAPYIVRETGETNFSKRTLHNYMPSVILHLRECTSVIDKEKWEEEYNNANERQKKQLIYAMYNCNLYTTDEIPSNVVPAGIKNKSNNYSDLTAVEPAMVEYKYNNSSKSVEVVKNYGTTKDYILMQEGCMGPGGKSNPRGCGVYSLFDYDDEYYKTLGVDFDSEFEFGRPESPLFNNLYCSGNQCYKKQASDGTYKYNPGTTYENDFTTVDTIYDSKGKIKYKESGKIASYDEWADKLNDPNYKSITETKGAYTIPWNDYASFIIVTESGFYNSKQYYADNYTGVIRTEETLNPAIISAPLDRNILPLQLKKETNTYKIEHIFDNIYTAYPRSEYYEEKNYSLFDSLSTKNPGTVNYVCEYDVYNTTTIYKNEGIGLGFTYRNVDLKEMFPSVSASSRVMPENWSNEFAQSVKDSIQNSYQDILLPGGSGAANRSYLEYSYTLTPNGINQIRDYNDENDGKEGYLENTLYECVYDDENKLFYNCKSSFLNDTNGLMGMNQNSVKINKNDGISEYCADIKNKDELFCKYQFK